MNHLLKGQSDIPIFRVTGSTWAAVRPPEEMIHAHRELGVWRDTALLGDLRRWRDATPDAIAVTAYRAGSGVQRLTYRMYAHLVERFAGALYELGVRPGQAVAVQLPNWWQVNVLALACARLDAVFVPVMTTVRPRELERILTRLQAVVCVTVNRWEDSDHAGALAAMAPRLPELRHRVVIGENVADDEIDFAAHLRQPWEQRHPVGLDEAQEDPDRVAVAVFTSGTAGEPKGVLHSFNTLYAGLAFNTPRTSFGGEEHFGPRDTFYTPHAVTHIAGMSHSIVLPLLVGGQAMMMDGWEPEAALHAMSETDTTMVTAAPAFASALAATARTRSRRLPALRWVRCCATSIPAQTVADVASVFNIAAQAVWGTTEVPVGTLTRTGEPADWAAHSDGRPIPGTEIELRADGEITRERPARLFVRGAAVCLAVLAHDNEELTIVGAHDEGWYDTGDLVVPDGRGGIRLVGRAADRIGGTFMIPVNDVESALRAHPAVTDVALVGYTDGSGAELACAVVVPRAVPPTLDALRRHLTELGMADRYQPNRLEVVSALPLNSSGKVSKELLRRRLRGEAGPAAGA